MGITVSTNTRINLVNELAIGNLCFYSILKLLSTRLLFTNMKEFRSRFRNSTNLLANYSIFVLGEPSLQFIVFESKVLRIIYWVTKKWICEKHKQEVHELYTRPCALEPGVVCEPVR